MWRPRGGESPGYKLVRPLVNCLSARIRAHRKPLVSMWQRLGVYPTTQHFPLCPSGIDGWSAGITLTGSPHGQSSLFWPNDGRIWLTARAGNRLTARSIGAFDKRKRWSERSGGGCVHHLPDGRKSASLFRDRVRAVSLVRHKTERAQAPEAFSRESTWLWHRPEAP
jgi:hypothetical protein